MALDLAEMFSQVQRMWAMFAGNPVPPNDATKFLNGVGGYTTINAPFRDALLLNFVESTDVANPLTVSANTWTTIIANQNFTVANASHLLDVNVNAGMLVVDDAIAIGALLRVVMRVQIDSTTGYQLDSDGVITGVLNNNNAVMGAGSCCIGTLSAGVHTIRLQVLANVALNTGASGFYLRANTSPDREFARIQVVERGGF